MIRSWEVLSNLVSRDEQTEALSVGDHESFIVTFEDSDAESEEDADDEIEIGLDAEGYNINETKTDDDQKDDEQDSNEGDELKGDDAGENDPVFWVRCDKKSCQKWRLLEMPWTKKTFKCSAHRPPIPCDEPCDGCDNTACSCPRT